jgi:hypothetical protein
LVPGNAVSKNPADELGLTGSNGFFAKMRAAWLRAVASVILSFAAAARSSLQPRAAVVLAGVIPLEFKKGRVVFLFMIGQPAFQKITECR